MSENEEIVADRDVEIPGMEEEAVFEEDVAVEPETNVVVMYPDNNQNEIGIQKEQTDSARKQQTDLDGIGIPEILNLSDVNMARVGESITDVNQSLVVMRILVILLRLIYSDLILLILVEA